MKRLITIFTMVAASTLYALAQTAKPVNDAIQKGNTLYRQQQYQQAEAAYNEALSQQTGNTTARFNRANAYYRQSKNSEAVKAYEGIIMDADKPEIKGNSFYNKGVIMSGEKKLEESIEAYKNALRQDPANQQARENLQKALLELKKKKPDTKKQDNKKQQQQKQQQQPRMNQKEAQQRLKLLEQKEKQLQQRMQKSKSQSGGGQRKDW